MRWQWWILCATACGTELEYTEPAPECAGPATALATKVFDASVTDTARARRIDYRIQYTADFAGCMPVVVVSHGGAGGTGGQLSLQHLGAEYAAWGYLAVHVNHLPSTTSEQHLIDAPTDMRFVLDALERGQLGLPADLRGRVEAARTAAAGQSWGAYVAHALGGGSFGVGDQGDARVKAIAPISPQGPGQLGAFHRSPEDNSWRSVRVPTYTLVGAVEQDSSYGDDPPVTLPGWRLYPFEDSVAPPDRFLSVLAGQDHVQMGDGGSAETKAFLAGSTRRFFDLVLRGDGERCAIGRAAGVETRTKPGCL